MLQETVGGFILASDKFSKKACISEPQFIGPKPQCSPPFLGVLPREKVVGGQVRAYSCKVLPTLPLASFQRYLKESALETVTQERVVNCCAVE